MINYYNVLEVSPTASKEQIKEAYKKISVKMHPDKNEGDEYYTEIFQAVNEARVILTDEVKRAEYDQLLKRSYRNNSHSTPGSFKSLNKKWIFLLSATAAFLIFVILLPSSDVKQLQQQREFADLNSSIPQKNERVNQRVEVKPIIGSLGSTEVAEEEADKTLSDIGSLKTALNSLYQPLNKAIKGSSITLATSTAKPANSIKLPTTKLAKAPTIQLVEEVAPIVIKQLDEARMLDILGQLKTLKTNSASSINCVRILKTKNSNVENAFDLAAFLQRNGFIISGRETIKNDVAGVEIYGNDGCFYVTIGSY